VIELDSTISTVKSYIFSAQLNALLSLAVSGDQNHFLLDPKAWLVGLLNPQFLIQLWYGRDIPKSTPAWLTLSWWMVIICMHMRLCEMPS